MADANAQDRSVGDFNHHAQLSTNEGEVERGEEHETLGGRIQIANGT
jgi:hypothetical protein